MKVPEVSLKDTAAHTTEVLADYSHGLRREDIPAATIETIQRCVLDVLGAAAAGARSDAALVSRRTAERLSGEGGSEIWFGGKRRQAAGAAFANSAAASALDIDDGHRASGGHPGASVIPAVFALSQETQTGWPEVLAGIAIGYEVGVRVAAARDLRSLDTFSTGRWCAFGVAAAAGRLRRLSIRQTAEAMALAGVLSPGLSAAGYSKVMGNHAKEGIPWATLTGLWAAELAAGGFTGPLDILDHPAYYDASKILEGLGERFVVDEVYFKPYACCRWIHAALDAFSGLVERHNLRPAEILSIEVHTFERALRLNNYPDPENLESAQYSIPFCLAVTAAEGKNGLVPIRQSLLHRADLVGLARRVTLHVDPELDPMFPKHTPARVIIGTDRGRFESICHHPLGDPDAPMRWEMVVGKFQHLTQGILTRARQEGIIQAVDLLPTQGPAALMDCLAEPVGSP